MQPPLFSIVIPTKGRTANLKKCLESISLIDYEPDRYEVIVVFDGCDPVDLPQFGQALVRSFNQPQSGPAAARNLGASQARGDYLAFTDDDCTLAQDWLRQLSTAINQYPDRLIGGKIINALPDNLYAVASQLLVDYLYERYNQIPDGARFLTSNNMAVSRDRFHKTGGFDTRFPLAAGEDRDFCFRWLARDQLITYEEKARVWHANQLTLSGFWQQHLNYGRGAYRFRQKKARQKDVQLKLERWTFYMNLLRYPFKRGSGHKSIPLFFLFIIMQVATTFGFLSERLQRSSPNR